MKVRFDILRRKNAASKPYMQSFEYEYENGGMTVAAVLNELNRREPLKDINGENADLIRWECSCMQKKCGACAMLINGRPRLACDAKLSEYGDEIRLEPFRKFPVVADLISDRTVIFENLKTIGAWLEKNAEIGENRAALAHESSRCLQCGCCLEVCPNFSADTKFKGMAAAVPLSRLVAQVSEDEKKRIFKAYSKYFYSGCGKSLACRCICPAGIDAEMLMVNSNAAAIWKRKRKK